jgi:hypothetical protein
MSQKLEFFKVLKSLFFLHFIYFGIISHNIYIMLVMSLHETVLELTSQDETSLVTCHTSHKGHALKPTFLDAFKWRLH